MTMMTTTSPPPASTSSRAASRVDLAPRVDTAVSARRAIVRHASSASMSLARRVPVPTGRVVGTPGSRHVASPARPSDTPHPPRLLVGAPTSTGNPHHHPPQRPPARLLRARDVRRLGSPPERPLGARRRARSRLRLARRPLRGTRGSRASGVSRQTPGRSLRPPHAHHRARARRRPVVRTPRAGPRRPQTLPRRRRRLRRRSRQIRTRVPFPRLAQQPSVGVRGPERLEQRHTGLRRGDSTERRNRSRAAVRAQQSRKREVVRRGLRRRVGGLRRLRRRVSGMRNLSGPSTRGRTRR